LVYRSLESASLFEILNRFGPGVLTFAEHRSIGSGPTKSTVTASRQTHSNQRLRIGLHDAGPTRAYYDRLLIWGTGQLTDALAAAGLLDEYRICTSLASTEPENPGFAPKALALSNSSTPKRS
jgi:hypothetical protein